ncbi:MAG: hypothetical protein EZS28_002585 [Streblomastix strix]|uniref:Replication factor A protein 3 n=1 Tax=Streblomastix strix TaxID=222440 RepID=A0A5J4X3U7_9EUKA|nr:MAG: hypothetical protein EZS28_002585 [Streblomastix strix]
MEEAVAADATPRINSELMQNYIGRTVRFVGKVDAPIGGDGSQLVLIGSDSGRVSINREPESQFPTSQYVEIVGNVDSNDSITEVLLVEFGNNFDLAAYDQCVRLINGPFSKLFI